MLIFFLIMAVNICGTFAWCHQRQVITISQSKLEWHTKGHFSRLKKTCPYTFYVLPWPKLRPYPEKHRFIDTDLYQMPTVFIL